MLTPAFFLIDVARRRAGRLVDAAGSGSGEAPFRIVAKVPGARLRAYQPARDSAGPVLLILPAPIKRPYLWDLLPEVSVVRHCLRRGLRVYLLEWLDPGPAEDGFGLAHYADRLPLAALDAIAAETGEGAALLAGHSLGGTLAAVFASLQPGRVRGLALIDAPLAFGPREGGPLARAVAALPPARALRAQVGSPVPGSFVGLLAAAAVPEAFVLQRWGDVGASLADPLALAVHARVERWALDEFALPGQLFEDLLERLYREDRFVAGRLDVGGRRTGVAGLRGPLLAVVNPPRDSSCRRPPSSPRSPPSPRCPPRCCATGAAAARGCSTWVRSCRRRRTLRCGRGSWTGWPLIGSPSLRSPWVCTPRAGTPGRESLARTSLDPSSPDTVRATRV